MGTGLGPTLEFYTLLSHELQRQSLGMWRHDGPAAASSALVAEAKQAAVAAAAQALNRTISGPGPLANELVVDRSHSDSVHSSELVQAPLGLFPAPLAPSGRGAASEVLQHFSLLGRTVAKALQDGRMLDMALSPVFYRLALGRRVDLYDVRRFDPALGASIEKLIAACAAHEAPGDVGAAMSLLVDGCPVEDLCLSFELPGYPAYPLHGSAGTTPGAEVTAVNLGEYIEAVVDATMGSGVAAQVGAFREGFNAIFPITSLTSFYEDEIEAMLCGESWKGATQAQM